VVREASMEIPTFSETGLDNLYQAHLAESGRERVLCVPLDAIPIPQRVRLVKIDAEGHDLEVLRGMDALLRRDRPTLIVEASETGEIAEWLHLRGYAVRRASNSSNIIATPESEAY
jgi:hypothetical protein